MCVVVRGRLLTYILAGINDHDSTMFIFSLRLSGGFTQWNAHWSVTKHKSCCENWVTAASTCWRRSWTHTDPWTLWLTHVVWAAVRTVQERRINAHLYCVDTHQESYSTFSAVGQKRSCFLILVEGVVWCSQQLISLAKHKDWKREETASPAKLLAVASWHCLI